VGQTKDIAGKLAENIFSQCLARRLRTMGRVASAIYERELSPYGITVSQFGVITLTLNAGGKSSPSLFTETLKVEKSTLSRNLRLMQRAGWITLSPVGRTVDIEVTREGKKIYLRSSAGWKRAQTALKRIIRNEGVDAIEELFSYLKDA